jgi:dipeptide/tripeptide permease
MLLTHDQFFFSAINIGAINETGLIKWFNSTLQYDGGYETNPVSEFLSLSIFLVPKYEVSKPSFLVHAERRHARPASPELRTCQHTHVLEFEVATGITVSRYFIHYHGEHTQLSCHQSL